MKTNYNPTEKENALEILKRMAKEVTKKLNGKKLTFNKNEIEEQYDERARKAGIN